MPKQPTKKSQQERKVKCRGCYVDMGRQLRIGGGEDWVCPKCGRRWLVLEREKIKDDDELILT